MIRNVVVRYERMNNKQQKIVKCDGGKTGESYFFIYVIDTCIDLGYTSRNLECTSAQFKPCFLIFRKLQNLSGLQSFSTLLSKLKNI